jgi:L,D-transpeptidase catalytic domain
VIRPEQLAAALERLPPRDWEILDLSLRRRVPDESLAKVFECESAEVARRRAVAIEHLADELEVKRGEDLGSVLQALLDPETWEAAEAAVEGGKKDGWRAFAEPEPDRPDEPQPAEHEAAEERPAERNLRLAPVPEEPAEAVEGAAVEPVEEPRPEASEETEIPPAPAGEQETVAEQEAAPEGEPEQPAEDEPVTESHIPPATEPVLEMLAEREQDREGRRSTWLWVLVGGLVACAALAGAGYIGATEFGDEESTRGGDPAQQTRHFLPERGNPLAAPFPSDPRTGSCYSTVYVPGPTVLYRRPGGRRLLRVPARTEWGSPRIFSVVQRRGAWLAVLAPELRNGQVGWMRTGRARLDCVRWSLHVDLSRRALFVRRDGRTVRRVRIAIGSRRHPTPKGRFAVTDKLKVADKGSPYGCCVLALTGHQTRLPPDWPGGDRLAVHATSDLSSIGRAVSLGCMRSNPRHARWIIRTVPLGAPMFIRG